MNWSGGVVLRITRRVHNSQVINDALVRLEGGENSKKKEDTATKTKTSENWRCHWGSQNIGHPTRGTVWLADLLRSPNLDELIERPQVKRGNNSGLTGLPCLYHLWPRHWRFYLSHLRLLLQVLDPTLHIARMGCAPQLKEIRSNKDGISPGWRTYSFLGIGPSSNPTHASCGHQPLIGETFRKGGMWDLGPNHRVQPLSCHKSDTKAERKMMMAHKSP